MIQVKSLQSLGALGEKNKIWIGIENVFFESSSKKTFVNADERNAFRFKYLDWYAKHHPELFFLGLDQDQRVHGYICGTPETNSTNDLATLHPWFSIFSHLYLQYPAHLHINCAEKARGSGLGSTLLSVFENTLQAKGIVGVHLVTAPEARNVGFYDKNGYKFSQSATWKETSLLFMGKSLTTKGVEEQL